MDPSGSGREIRVFEFLRESLLLIAYNGERERGEVGGDEEEVGTEEDGGERG